jgi:hypothetical protein
VQQPNHPTRGDSAVVNRVVQRQHGQTGAELLATARRYLLLRPTLFGTLLLLLLLHLVAPSAFDLGTLMLLLGIYLVAVGSGGLEAARLSGTGGDRRRQERLAEDALRRAGRLQSNLDPCSATDDVVNRLLASTSDPRRLVITAADEIEGALRAVYKHYTEAERMAGTSNGTDLPLILQVQELIYRGLLPPDIYETAEPILSLREIAQGPRSQISQAVARDVARVTQAIILRIQSMGIRIAPPRAPLTWLRHDVDEADDDLSRDGQRELESQGADSNPVDDIDPANPALFATPLVKDRAGQDATWRDPRSRLGTHPTTDSFA